MSYNPDLNTPYFPTVKPALAPAFLDAMAEANSGTSPRAISAQLRTASFHVVDLGCGFGLGPIYLAAAYPSARFTGIDIMPEHVQTANAIAADAGLDNVSFLASAFNDPVLNELELADYVTANAIYSWISPRVQNDLVALVDRLLKPQGVAYFSYNTVVGFGPAQPLRKVLYDLHRERPDHTVSQVVEEAKAVLAALAEAAPQGIAAYLLAKFEGQMDGIEADYIAHEYLSPDWTPIWTSDLAKHLATIDCTFVAEAEPSLFDHAYSLRKSERAALDAAPSLTARLNSLDLIRERPYTAALFQRQRSTSGTDNGLENSTSLGPGMALTRAAEDVHYEHIFGRMRMRYDTPTARALVAALSNGPETLAQLTDVAGGPENDAIASTVACLIQSSQAIPVDVPQGLDDETRADRQERLDRTLKVTQKRFPQMSQRPSLFGTPVPL